MRERYGLLRALYDGGMVVSALAARRHMLMLLASVT